MGSDVIRRATVLGHEQPGRDQRHRAGLPAAAAAGLPRLSALAHAGLLAEGTSQSAEVLRRGVGARQADP